MNGELSQISGIVISAVKALRDNKGIDYILDNYVSSVKFVFAEERYEKPIISNSVCEWFDVCKKEHIRKIKLFIPSEAENRHIAGYANSSNASVICYWKNNIVTYFVPEWKINENKQKWDVVYREYIWENAPKKPPRFTDRTEEFKQVLSDIEKLAADIGFESFADIFRRAYMALEDNSHIEDDKVPVYIPDKFRGLYYAVSIADVFGCMGSWNDSPPYYAEEKGLKKEYDELSGNLFKELRYNLMYIANEGWKPVVFKFRKYGG